MGDTQGYPPVARTVFVLGAVVTIGGLPVYLVSAIAVQLAQDMGLGIGGVGAATALFFGAAAMTSAPLAWLIGRIGAPTALRLGALVTAVCSLGLAMAPTVEWLLVGVGLAGVANSLAQPASNVIVVTLVPPDRRAFAFAAKQASVPGATLLAGLAVPTVALSIGWRWVFVLAVVLAVGAAAVTRWLPDSAMPVPSGQVGESWGLTLLAVSAGLAAGAANVMGAFVVVSAVDAGYEPAAAGFLLTAGSVVGLASRLLTGVVADRWRPDLLATVTGMMALGSIGLCLLAVGGNMMIAGVLLGFSSGWAWAGIFNLAVAARYPDRVAASTAVTQMGVYLGSAALPGALGWIAKSHGLSSTWLAAAAAMAIAAALLAYVRWVGSPPGKVRETAGRAR